MDTSSSFYNLDPQRVLAAVELAGLKPTGEFTQLNSYENRVFDIRLEENFPGSPYKNVIAKFYRPQRWSKEALQEEHDFLFELKKEGIPVIAPFEYASGKSLITLEDMHVAFFQKGLGRLPQEFLTGDLKQVGRMMAQLHNVGSRKPAQHRPTLGPDHPGAWDALDLLETWVTPELRDRYVQAAEDILFSLQETLRPQSFIRIHGDCHKGNLLHNGDSFLLVDFDDFINGPEVQDFWMLLSGDQDSLSQEQDEILSGYEELRDFPHEQWAWIPILRGFRIISYAAWVARRWSDPSFPRLFPEFNSYKYWAEEVEALEKIAWQL